MRIKTFLAVVLLGSSLSMRADTVDYIQAIVGESVITRQQVERLIAQDEHFLYEQYGRTQPDMYRKRMAELVDVAFRSIVSQQLVLHEFKTYEKQGASIPESMIDEIVQDRIRERYAGDRAQFDKQLQARGMTREQFRTQIREEIIYSELRNKFVPDPIISPHKVEVYYKDHQSDFKLEDRVKMRTIFLSKPADDTAGDTRKRMDDILALVKGGAVFSEVATSYSEGLRGKSAGPLEWVEVSGVNKALVDDLNKLKPGEYSGIIETSGALFLVFLEERDVAHVKPLSETRDEIEKILKSQESNRLYESWIKRLKAKTYISYF
ncbi:MAG: surA [Pedosphaera sp.]|nr:surA [Pedosphaera sp.]